MAVYFIAEEETERVKIGYSANPWRRLVDLQARNPNTLILMRCIYGAEVEEKRVHRFFMSQRLEGEWFAYSEAMFAIGETINIGPRQTAASSLEVA